MDGREVSGAERAAVERAVMAAPGSFEEFDTAEYSADDLIRALRAGAEMSAGGSPL